MKTTAAFGLPFFLDLAEQCQTPPPLLRRQATRQRPLALSMLHNRSGEKERKDIPMKKLLAVCLFSAALAAPALAADMASHGMLDLRTSQGKSQAMGQPVYDLQNTKIGEVAGFADAHGTPAVIISTDRAFGGHKVAAASQNLTPRADGDGMLLALSDSSVAQLPPYTPGQPIQLF
jgi:hypothetical protein